MDAKREKELVDLLNKYDVAGMPFVDAKHKLLTKGFTEAEIVYGLYSAPFDGKANKPRPANPLQKFYEQHPEKAEKIAATLLLVEMQKAWDTTISNAAASATALNTQSGAYYGVRTADNLGIPYFTIFFVVVIIVAAMLILNVPMPISKMVVALISLSINALFFYKLAHERYLIHKLKKQIRDKK